MSAADLSPRYDGRNLRARRNRTKLVASCRELMLAGELRPTAGEVAHRAGLSTRSVFQHFGSSEGLHLAAVEDAFLSTELVELILGPAAAKESVLAERLLRAVITGKAG